VIYAGSLERIDFGEENDDKGFYVVDILDGGNGGKRRVTYEFHPVHGRRFLTIKADLKAEETDPTQAVLTAIKSEDEKIRDAIVRLNIGLPSALEGLLRNNEIREALKEAEYFTVTRDIRREQRLRIGSRTAEELTPLDALKAYLETQKVPPERQKILLEYGTKLIEGKD
jgi:exonuclease SbcD